MTRVPFAAWVIALTALAGLLALLALPGRLQVAAGVAVGAGVAGGFAVLAVAVMRRIRSRASGDPTLEAEAPSRMARAFAGLMMARMLAYLALVIAAVTLGVIDGAGVGAGLVIGTLVFQVMEVVYLRKMS